MRHPRIEEYFQRTLQCKSVIERSSEIQQKIHSIVEHLYSPKGKKQEFPDGILSLGRGDSHTVAYLGTMVDPSTGNSLSVALKLVRPSQLWMLNDAYLASQLGAYEIAFEFERNPPHFVASTFANTHYGQFGGIIMEDITNGKTVPLLENRHGSFAFTMDKNGQKIRRFIDPGYLFEEYRDYGMKYLCASVYC